MRHRRFVFLTLILLCLLAVPSVCFSAGNGSVTGTVWIDKNADGIFRDEKTLSDVRITLESYDSDEEQSIMISDFKTDKDGKFSFRGLQAGKYRLKIELPKGYFFTDPDGESMAVPASGNISYSFPLLINGNETVANIGAVNNAAHIQIVAFEDLNANGGRLLSEPLLRNIEVRLLYEKNGTEYIVASAITDRNGEIRINSLSPADYRIGVLLPDTYMPGPIGKKINAFYNCILETDSDIAYSEPFRMDSKNPAALGIGLIKAGTLTGSVWFDQNSNGIHDPSETGYEGIRVCLAAAGSDRIKTALTDHDGNYTFPHLSGGDYSLSCDLPDELMYSYGSATLISGAWDTDVSVQVQAGTQTFIDPIGVMPDTCIRFLVYADQNLNGLFDEGETPVSKVPVTVYNAENTYRRSIMTDESGYAVFHDVTGGDLMMMCSLPDQYVFAPESSENLIGAKTALKVSTAQINASWGETQNYRIGVTTPAVVTGYVFEDEALAGTVSAISSPLAGFTVQVLDQEDTVLTQTVTDPSGAYVFDQLLGGIYKLRILYQDPYIGCPYTGDKDAGYTNHIISQTMEYGDTEFFTLLPETPITISMSLYQAGSISGEVLLNPGYDELRTNTGGLDGAVITLLQEDGSPASSLLTDTTKEDGAYYIKGIIPGNYFVVCTLPEGSVFLYQTDREQYRSEMITVKNGENVSIPTLAAVRTATFSGSVIHTMSDRSTEPVSAQVQFSSERFGTVYSATTDAEGFYSFEPLLPDTYTVKVVLPEGFAISGAVNGFVERSVESEATGIMTLNMGDAFTGMDISVAVPSRIQGRFYYDGNVNQQLDEGEAAYPETEITITGPNDYNAVYTTGPDGAYTSDLLLPGRYILHIKIPEDHTVLNRNQYSNGEYSVEAVAEDAGIASLDIAILKYGSIAGKIWDLGGDQKILPKIEISLLKDGKAYTSATADADGSFRFDRLYPGKYAFAMDLPEGFLYARKIDAENHTSKIVEGVSEVIDMKMGEEYDGFDIGIGMIGSIGDFAWIDLNGNGMQDIDEPGLPEVGIALYQYGQFCMETKTDVYGFYSFENLYPGTYELHITAPDEVKGTVKVSDFPLVASILPEDEEGQIIVEQIVVPSGTANLNCDLGFTLKEAGVYPPSMELVPKKDWTPYSQRKH